MTRVTMFDAQHLESIAKVLADTGDGLKGSQIGYILRDCKIPDPSPTEAKWKRLFNAFVNFQNAQQFGNHVVLFINKAMNPVQYTGVPAQFSERRDRLNAVLAFSGMEVGVDGKTRNVTRARDLDDALQRAGRLHAALVSRGVHADVLRYCKAELVQQNYFHAVFEATKSIAAKIRTKASLGSDGATLVTEAFALANGPLLRINSLSTETERGEQRGFVSLLIGLFGTIRNPAAHNPKIEWPMSEQDALDILTLASLVHRKIDAAK